MMVFSDIPVDYMTRIKEKLGWTDDECKAHPATVYGEWTAMLKAEGNLAPVPEHMTERVMLEVNITR